MLEELTLREETLRLKFEAFLSDLNLAFAAPEEEPAHYDWTVAVIEATKEHPDLFGYFIDEFFGASGIDTTKYLFETSANDYYVSRVFEHLAREIIELSNLSIHENNFEAINKRKKMLDKKSWPFQEFFFQLDTPAATAWAEATLVTHETEWFSVALDRGILSQKNIPTELADRILFECSPHIRTPLESPFFSEEALKKIEERELAYAAQGNSKRTKRLRPWVRITNPNVSDDTIIEVVKYGTAAFSHALQEVKFNLQRWKLLIEAIKVHSPKPQALLQVLTYNHEIPYELMKEVHVATEGYDNTANYVACHFDEWQADENRIEIAEESMATFILLLERDDLEWFYENQFRLGDELYILFSERTSAKLIERIMHEHPRYLDVYSYNVAPVSEEPNLFQLKGMYQNRNIEDLERFERDVNAVLIEKGMGDFTSAPLSWRVELLDLAIEQTLRNLELKAKGQK